MGLLPRSGTQEQISVSSRKFHSMPNMKADPGISPPVINCIFNTQQKSNVSELFLAVDSVQSLINAVSELFLIGLNSLRTDQKFDINNITYTALRPHSKHGKCIQNSIQNKKNQTEFTSFMAYLVVAVTFILYTRFQIYAFCNTARPFITSITLRTHERQPHKEGNSTYAEFPSLKCFN